MADLTCPDMGGLTPAEVDAFVDEAIAAAMNQVGKPLSISVAGRTISYGSAFEAINVAMQLRKMQRDQLELQVASCPWVGRSVARG